MERDIKLNWYFEQSPEQVWQCLTDVNLLNQWFMQSDFRAEVGRHFRFVSKPMPAVGWDGIVYSEVLEVVPCQKLVYTWKGGPKPGVINLDTVLTWTLRPQQNGTLLTLEHKGFKGMKNFLSSFLMEKGWKVNIERKFTKVLNQYSHAQA